MQKRGTTGKNNEHTDLVKKTGTNLICMLKKKMNTDLVRKRRTNLISKKAIKDLAKVGDNR